MSNFTRKQSKNSHQKRGLRSPFFYFGLFSFVLLGALFFGSESLAKLNYFNNETTFISSFAKTIKNVDIRKWETRLFGEIPADFGLKNK